MGFVLDSQAVVSNVPQTQRKKTTARKSVFDNCFVLLFWFCCGIGFYYSYWFGVSVGADWRLGQNNARYSHRRI